VYFAKNSAMARAFRWCESLKRANSGLLAKASDHASTVARITLNCFSEYSSLIFVAHDYFLMPRRPGSIKRQLLEIIAGVFARCSQPAGHGYRGLDALIAFCYASEVSTHVSISRCESMQEADSPEHQGQTVTKESPPAAKIELFRSLFRGRADVYPRRFESRKTGKAGYAPACANEWVRGVCEKPRIKCADCPNRRFLPVTDEVIRWHLSGRDHQGRDFVMGVYPLFQDETCFFLAVDFDRESCVTFGARCRLPH